MDYAAHPFFSGILFGVSIAAPVGPIGLLCIRTSLERGFRAGFLSGLGAASADLVYGILAVSGLAAAADAAARWQRPLALAGAAFLLYLAFITFKNAGKTVEESGKSKMGGFFTTFLLTLSNPMTILSFLAVMASFSGAGAGTAYGPAQVAAGVFAGSALWWMVLAGSVSRFQRAVTDGVRLWIDRISAGILAAFALAALLL